MARTSTKKLAGRLGVLGERNFRLFFTGYITSLVGSAMVPVALTFAVLNQGDGTDAVGYVLGAETVPLVALLLLGGVVADRVPRRVAMIGADLIRFASEGLLAVLLLTGSAPLWTLLVLAAVLGIGQAFFNPAMTGLMPEMVSAERLQPANALRGLASSAGQVFGPALAGVIVATGGAGWAIAIDALTYAVSAACLLRLTIPPRPPAEPSSMLAQLAGGWHEFRSHTWLWVIVAQFATWNALCFAPFMVLGAITAHDRLGGAGPWGVILSALGAGSILGGLLSVRLRARRPLVTATLGVAIFTLPLALIAVPTATVLIAVAAGLAGVGFSVFGTLWETTLQREIPRAVLSRVSAYDWFGSVAFVPVGYLIAAPLASLLGLRTALFFAAAWAAASCAAVLAVPGVRNLRNLRHATEPPHPD
ncbi:MAG TPA: MFS transporter [Streptosporangiaceae bacterium]|nr:MFS transporter [Streptosporangiaceae bacterium]